MPQLGFAEHQLEVALSEGPYPDQSNAACRFLEQALTDCSCTYSSRAHTHRCCQSAGGGYQYQTWGYQKLKTSVNTNSKITCLAEKFGQIFHGRNPHTQCCCSSHKCMFLTNGAPLERELKRLSNGIRFIAKKYCYHREIIYQTQIFLLFVQNLNAVHLWFNIC